MFGIVAGAAGVAAAASVYGYGAMAPRSQLFGATVHDSADPRQIALTYDDGPNDPHTLRLLEVLARHNVKATFFLIGEFVRARPQIAREIAAAGHAVGNHTQTHPNLFWTSARAVRHELAECERSLDDAIGGHAPLFRPPYGARRPEVLNIARALGLTPVMWSVTCYDWRTTAASEVEQEAVRQIGEQKLRGKILLLHDGGHRRMGEDRGHTVEATERLIRRYKDEGLQFATVPEMMNRK
jgi:peptidoglycan/xylan/chitin deacetylase (PgdA/CDA1 family)